MTSMYQPAQGEERHIFVTKYRFDPHNPISLSKKKALNVKQTVMIFTERA